MFGRKKKGKQIVKTFIDGVEQEKNPEIAPVLEPEQVPAQEPPQSQEAQPEPVQVVVDCLICSQDPSKGAIDYGFYVDAVGVWHPCPRCNPEGKITPYRKESEPKAKSKKKR